MPACYRRLIDRIGLGVRGAEGVVDPRVGRVALPVDAVRVDLQQDRDAEPGAAGDLGRGKPQLGQSDTGPGRRPTAAVSLALRGRSTVDAR